jgi:hypothetical protein
MPHRAAKSYILRRYVAKSIKTFIGDRCATAPQPSVTERGWGCLYVRILAKTRPWISAEHGWRCEVEETEAYFLMQSGAQGLPRGVWLYMDYRAIRLAMIGSSQYNIHSLFWAMIRPVLSILSYKGSMLSFQIFI